MTKSTLTLTQSGLLAVLLEQQRRKVIQLARRRAYRAHVRVAFSHMLGRSLRVVGGGRSATIWRLGTG